MTTRPQVVVITGASAGVGRAAALAFAKRGARIGLLARDPLGLEDARREVESLGGRAIAVPTDVADAAQVEAAAEEVEAQLGEIDVWVNNAMSTVFARFVEIEPDEFKRATDVTYLGAVHGTMAALKRMLPRDHGAVVQVGSALSYRAIPLQSAYCGAKFAMRGFTDALRTELLHDGSNVWVTMVQLPAVNTPQFDWCRSKLPKHPQPVPPIYQPEVAGEAVYWAAQHRRREVVVGFSSMKAIVGNQARASVRRLVSRPHRIPVAAGPEHAGRGTRRKPLRPSAWRLDARQLRRARAAAELPAVGDDASCAARDDGGLRDGGSRGSCGPQMNRRRAFCVHPGGYHCRVVS
jgi:NAD(P)-dependent dehydrogenase (short-subunit alcohol dehydrogenase family)